MLILWVLAYHSERRVGATLGQSRPRLTILSPKVVLIKGWVDYQAVGMSAGSPCQDFGDLVDGWMLLVRAQYRQLPQKRGQPSWLTPLFLYLGIGWGPGWEAREQ